MSNFKYDYSNMDNETYDKGVKSVGDRSKTLQQNIHELACYAVANIEGWDGNLTRVNALVNGLGGAVKSNKLMQWFGMFGSLTFVSEKKNGVTTYKAKLPKGWKDIDPAELFHAEDGHAEPFWAFKVEAESTAFDVKELEELLEKLSTGKHGGAKTEISDKVMTLAASMHKGLLELKLTGKV